MSENNQKIKLIKIVEYLKTESSITSPITTKQLIGYLNSINITCDRRTLYKDMELLIENGSSIVKTEMNKGNAYYIDDDSFSLAELKILIDAVQSANFITDTKTEKLISKIIAMAGMRKKEIIRDNIIFYNNHKHSNEEIFDNIEQIERAIQLKRQISFFYFDLDENAERVYRKGKKRYITDPIALVYNQDNYYLVSYSQKYSNNANYRVDRMSCVEIEETPICSEAKIRKRKPETYTEQVFKMYNYNGEATDIVLEFDFNCIGAVFDKFGEKLKIKRINDKYRTSVKVQISPPFKSWLYQFGDKMKVVVPKDFTITIGE